jgi:hypothetical protein
VLASGVLVLAVVGVLVTAACGVLAFRRLRRWALRRPDEARLWAELVARHQELDRQLDRVWHGW